MISTPVEKLFTFAVSEEVLSEFTEAVRKNKKRFLDRELKSEQVLNSMDIIFS